MVSALPVLGRVIDGAAHDLDLTQREVSLIVGGVVGCVPQVELRQREQIERLLLRGGVREPDSMDLGIRAERHNEQYLGANPSAFAGDCRV